MLRTNVSYGPTLDDRIAFIEARNGWADFFTNHLDDGKPSFSLGVRISDYLERNGLEGEISQQMRSCLSEMPGELLCATEIQMYPWRGYKGESFGENAARFADKLLEKRRDVRVGKERFLDRTLTPGFGAKYGAILGLGISSAENLYRVIASPVGLIPMVTSTVVLTGLFAGLGALSGVSNQCLNFLAKRYHKLIHHNP